MASWVKQGLVVVKNKNNHTGNYLLAIQKTGYANIWIGSQHIYWNYNAAQTNTDKVDVGAAIQSVEKPKKKQVILIRRT